MKINGQGKILQHNAKLLPKTFLQIPGIDFTGVFLPVFKYITIRTMFTFPMLFCWKSRFLDVKMAFVNALLSGEIHVAQPMTS